MSKKRGTIIAIGGREDKEGEKAILSEISRRIKGKFVITAVASEEPQSLLKDYRELFKSLGIKNISVLEVKDRNHANDEKCADVLRGAKGVFFTGGDQLRITSQIGNSLVFQRLWEIYKSGGLIAGTSAGASVMCSTMLIEGKGGRSPTAGGVKMGPGLGLIENAIVDQHFAERGRMGRLLYAVAENPRLIGIGIDEDTAIIFEGGKVLSVLGKGAVYVLDATQLSFSNIADETENNTVSIFNIKLHVLSEGDTYDLLRLTPHSPKQPKGERHIPARGKEMTPDARLRAEQAITTRIQ